MMARHWLFVQEENRVQIVALSEQADGQAGELKQKTVW